LSFHTPYYRQPKVLSIDNDHYIGEMGQALQFLSNGTFVIAISLAILAGVLSYTHLRSSSRRKRGALNDTIIRFNYQKPHLLMDGDSLRSQHKGVNYARNSLFNSQSASFTSIKISPSRPNEIEAEGIIRVVLTPPTPAKRERRESLID